MNAIPKTVTAVAHVATIDQPADDGANVTVTGVITSFGVDSSHGIRFTSPDALTPREPLSRVKLLLDHDQAKPIGFMTELDMTAAVATFEVPPTPAGLEALDNARAGLRTGLSVGCAIKQAELDNDGNLLISNAELYEVSLVAIPAFADAEITSIATAMMTEKENPTMTETTENEPTPERPSEHAQASIPTTAIPRPRNLADTIREVSAAIAKGDHNQVRAALQDVVPANDKGAGLLRDDWRGELWTADTSPRPIIDALGAPTALGTGTKVKGWRWKERPKVDTYAGNKTEIPSNKVSTEPIETTVKRVAGGWDIDRIFLDLGEPGFLEAFWSAAVADYKRLSNATALTDLKAGAGVKTLQAQSLLGSLGELGATFAKLGASIDAIFIAPDLFDAYAQLTQAEVPFWLANATGVSVKNATATVADLSVKTLPDLKPGEVLAFDKRAATYYEKTPPIRVNAVDLPRGGIDLALFGYQALLVNDPRAIVSATVKKAE